MLPLSRCPAKGMVSPSKPATYSRVATSLPPQKSPKLKLVRGPRPLANYRFYLDIEKHHVSSKIDRRIKELGGSIEFFLVKEVTHFVTDKQQASATASNQNQSPTAAAAAANRQRLNPPGTPQTPQTPRTPATPQTPAYAEANDTPQRAPPPKPLSRADAMLQRARRATATQHSHHPEHQTPDNSRQQQQTAAGNSNSLAQHRRIDQSPVHLAKSWNTPIWTPEYTLKFLDKVLAALAVSSLAGEENGPGHSNAGTQSHSRRSRTPTTNATAAAAATNASAAGGGQTPRQLQQPPPYKPRAANPKRLRGDYFKVEAFDRHYRPYYKEFRGWPQISLNTQRGFCPFWQNDGRSQALVNTAPKRQQPAKTKTTVTGANNALQPSAIGPPAMTRKNRSKSSQRINTIPKAATPATTVAKPGKTAAAAASTESPTASTKPSSAASHTTEAKCGYCEICHLEYETLAAHLQSAEHKLFVTNNENFRTLDAMIDTGANMEAFLARNQKCAAAAKREVSDEEPEEHTLVVVATAATIDQEQERVFGKRSAGKKTVKPFRANGRGSSDIKRASEDASFIGSAEPARVDCVNGVAATDVELSPKAAKRVKLSTTPPKRKRSSNASTTIDESHSAVKLIAPKLPAAAPPTVQLLERSSKAAAKAAVAAVVAVEEADDDDDPHHHRHSNGDAGHRKRSRKLSKTTLNTDKSQSSATSKSSHNQSANRITSKLPSPPAPVKPTAASDDREPPADGNRVRSRRESAKRINYDEGGDDDDSPSKPFSAAATAAAFAESLAADAIADCAPSTSTNSTAATTKSPQSTKQKRKIEKLRLRSIRWRAPSEENRRSTMSQPFYKVVEDSASATASAAPATDAADRNSKKPQQQLEPQASGRKSAVASDADVEASKAAASADAPDLGLKLRVCRVRNSELSALTTEADKFMFPPRRSSTEAPTDEDRQSTSEISAAELSADLLSSEPDRSAVVAAANAALDGRRRSRTGSASSATKTAAASAVAAAPAASTSSSANNALDASNKRKRRKQLEAFLNDNSEYYKFDNPDHRLRFQEAPFQPNVSSCSDSVSVRATPVKAGDESRPTSPAASPLSQATPTKPPSAAKRAAQSSSAQSSPAMTSTAGGRRTRFSLQQQQRTPTRAAASQQSRAHVSEDGKGAFGTPETAEKELPPTQHKTLATAHSSASPSLRQQLFGASDADVQPVESDITGELLRSDVVLKHKFAFERVPSQEPWYKAFQRQDEGKERIFEYWGNTAYRKLPYELGPLPPHAPDCCALAQLTPAKRTPRTPKKKVAGRRTGGSRQTPAEVARTSRPSSAASNAAAAAAASVPSTTVAIAASSSGVSSGSGSSSLDRLHDIQVQKRLLKLHKNLEVNVLPMHQSTAAPPPSANSRTAALLAATVATASLEVRMHKRKIPLSQRQQQQRQLQQLQQCEEAGLAGKLGNTALQLDINGRPRKSPREHASTLAILSCLVQQRRKREKELNGGISPEKLRPHHRHRRDDSEEPVGDDDNAQPIASASERTSAPSSSSQIGSRRRAAKRSIKVEPDSDGDEPVDIPADPPPTPPPDGETAAAAAEAADDASDDDQKPATKKNPYPPMPRFDYVCPQLLCRQIDEQFSTAYFGHDYLADMDPADMLIGDADCDDLALIGKPRDFAAILRSVPEGPLRYQRYKVSKKSKRAAARLKPLALALFGPGPQPQATAGNRKRRNNRTGWPTPPRRRTTTGNVIAAVASSADEQLPAAIIAKTEAIDDSDSQGAAESVRVSVTKAEGEMLVNVKCEQDEEEEDDDEDDDRPLVIAARPDSSTMSSSPVVSDALVEDETTCSSAALTTPITERDDDEEEDDDQMEVDEEVEDGDVEESASMKAKDDSDGEEEEAIASVGTVEEEDVEMEDDVASQEDENEDQVDQNSDALEDADTCDSNALANEDDVVDEERVDEDDDVNVKTEVEEEEEAENAADDDEESIAALNRSISVVAYVSSSEKAEHSDTFAVSSDSGDTADLTTANTPNVGPPILIAQSHTIAKQPTSKLSSPEPPHLEPAVDDNDAEMEEAAAVSDFVDRAEPAINVARGQATSKSKQKPRRNGPGRPPGRKSLAAKLGKSRGKRTSVPISTDSSAAVGSSSAIATSESSSSSSLDAQAVPPPHPAAAIPTTTALLTVSVSRQTLSHQHRLMLQPIVRVRKINVMTAPDGSVMRRRSVRSEERLAAALAVASTSSSSAAANRAPADEEAGCNQTTPPLTPTRQHQQQQVQVAVAVAAAQPSPKTQFSPPKLRKPRGRWYRER